MAGEQQVNEINAMLVSYGYQVAFTADPTNRGYSCSIKRGEQQLAFYPFGATKWDALIGAMGRLLEFLDRRPNEPRQ